jgi:hypothetical protein
MSNAKKKTQGDTLGLREGGRGIGAPHLIGRRAALPYVSAGGPADRGRKRRFPGPIFAGVIIV